MKLFTYKLKVANPQYDNQSEIIIADVSETKAIEKAEEITNCALSVEEWLGLKEYDGPCIIKNTFSQNKL